MRVSHRYVPHKRVSHWIYTPYTCISQAWHFINMYLTGVHLTGVHLTGAHLIGVHLKDAYLIGVYLMDVYLMGVLYGRTSQACIS